MPTWSIVHSRHWKMQIPYLARHCRVVTFDARGNGRSDRPADAAYAERGVRRRRPRRDGRDRHRARGVVVSLSLGAQRALLLAAEHPERVSGAVVHLPGRSPIGGRRRTAGGKGSAPPGALVRSDRRRTGCTDYRDFLECFFGRCSPSRTRPSRSRTASAGAYETTPERRSARRRPGSCDERRDARARRARPLPGARDPGGARRDHGPRPRGGARRRRRAASS